MASLSPGQSFGRYEIDALLGEGGMGEVYRARDTKLRRNVALKVIHPDVQAGGLTQGVVSRFTREAQAAAALAHTNVVTVFDVGDVDGVPFIAMELLDGVTLRSLISGRTSIAQRLEWLLETAHALAAAHALGMVHRDVKPENIMICGGHVKMLDFGIAKWIDEVAPELSPRSDAAPSIRTGTGHAVGTPRYMAPEQTRGRTVDASADQFAWGIVAYEVLAREHPQERAGHFTKEADWAAPPVPLAELVPELPFGVSAIVMKALGRWPKDRFEGMEDVIATIGPILARFPIDDAPFADEINALPSGDTTTIADSEIGGPVSDAVDVPPPTPEPRAPRQVGLIPAIVLAILAIAGVAIVTAPTKPPPLPVAAVPSAVAPDRVDIVIDFLPLGIPANPKIGEALALAKLDVACFDKDFGRVYLQKIDSGTMRVILTHEPGGFIMNARVMGLGEYDELATCLEVTLTSATLPPNLPGTELSLAMKVLKKSAPPPRNAPIPIDETKVKFTLFSQPVEKLHYDDRMIERALDPPRSEIVDCRRFELWRNVKDGVFFNVHLQFDAKGKIEKRIVEAPIQNLAFNECMRKAIAHVTLPAPKDNAAGKVRVTMILSPVAR